MSKLQNGLRHWCQETKGAVMVEFAVVCLVFLLIVAGIMDLGHAFFMKQVITNASREGARYGVVYQTDSAGNRRAPSNFSPSISSHILNDWNLPDYLPADANPQVTPGGAGYTTGNAGAPLEVTVTAVKNWFVLNNFIPSLNESVTLSATTVMQCE